MSFPQTFFLSDQYLCIISVEAGLHFLLKTKLKYFFSAVNDSRGESQGSRPDSKQSRVTHERLPSPVSGTSKFTTSRITTNLVCADCRPYFSAAFLLSDICCWCVSRTDLPIFPPQTARIHRTDSWSWTSPHLQGSKPAHVAMLKL